MQNALFSAYQTLMAKAPGAAFRKARALYLNKYSFPEKESSSAFRLFICRETLEEGLRPADDGNPDHQIVSLTTTAQELAVVHWQNPAAPDMEALTTYLREEWYWEVDPSDLTPWSEPWFREGGHQSRLKAPSGLQIKQESLLTLRE